MKLFLINLLILYISNTQSSVYTNPKRGGKSLTHKTHNEKVHNDEPRAKESPSRSFLQRKNDAIDAKRAHFKARVLQKAKTIEDRLNHGRDIPASRLSGDPNIGKEYYHMDPVLNQLRRTQLRRALDGRRRRSDTSDTSSSSLEMKDWRDEFREQWMQKKFEAINSSDARGDVVNMVAARPWGVACGDPNQHDMPWGNCLLPMECDSEYRIYRGDYFCGRTQFVCCALQLTNYDMYQGFDVSFADTSFSTDTEERKARDRGSKETKKRKKNKARNKRRKERRRRKRKIKRNIRKIVHEIRKILNRSFRNATHHRKKRTKLLKKYIKELKKQYKKDRKSVRDVHTIDMERVDLALLKKLEDIRNVNKNFFRNATFRDIVVNGTINKQGARMLVEAYPELEQYLRGRLRRGGGGEVNKDTNGNGNYLEYDVEYGELYF